jgi:antitoxin component of RelBE/YafQ-DinJ toxin-antitoxin module
MKVEVRNVITELHSTRNARERSTEAMITEEALQKNAPAVFDRLCHAISKLLQLLLLLPIAAISSGFPHKYNTKNKNKETKHKIRQNNNQRIDVWKPFCTWKKLVVTEVIFRSSCGIAYRCRHTKERTHETATKE